MQVTEIRLMSNHLDVFCDKELDDNARVVVSVDGYLELGTVKRKVDTETKNLADFVRYATSEDNKHMCENCAEARRLLPEIKAEAEKQNLEMKVGFISINLDRTKLTVHYTADGRIDFRELVKILGAKYKIRVEMKQIGNRDETKIIGAMGVCGRETCCKLFLNDFDKMSIKMAKNQGIALNPSRINGMCGRLLCCLKYEDDYYTEMQKKMPKVHSKVSTPDGVGVVDSIDIFSEVVRVKFENKEDETTELKNYALAEIKPLERK